MLTTTTPADPELNPTPTGEPTITEAQGRLIGFTDDRGGFRKFIDTIQGVPSTASVMNNSLALQREGMAGELAKLKAIAAIEGQNALALERLRLETPYNLAQKSLLARANSWNPTYQQLVEASESGNDLNTLEGKVAELERQMKMRDDQQQHLYKVKIIDSTADAAVGQTAGILSGNRQDYGPAALARAKASEGEKQAASELAIQRTTAEKAYRTANPNAVNAALGATIQKPIRDAVKEMQVTVPENSAVMQLGLNPNSGYSPETVGMYIGGYEDSVPTGQIGLDGKPIMIKRRQPPVSVDNQTERIRAELNAARGKSVSRNPVAAGQFYDVGNQGVVRGGQSQPAAPRVAPVTTAVPQAGGFVPAIGRAANSALQPFGSIGQAGYSTIRGLGDLIYKDPEGSPEREAKLQDDAKMYEMFQKWRNSKVTDVFGGQPKQTTADTGGISDSFMKAINTIKRELSR
jgi:hypothetical protein